MSLYSIKDTTLTAIGDAIRQKAGGEITRFETDYFEAKGESAVVPAGGDAYLYYTFPGAATITIGLTNIVKPKEGIIRMGGGRVTNGNSTTLPFKISGSTTEDFDTFSNCDGVVTLRCSDAEGTYSFDVWMYGYDETGDFVTGVWETVTYKNYKPTEMPDAILSIQGGGSGGFTPAGQIDITANGNYDIAEYASAQVTVPVGVFPSGDLAISANGKYTVTEKNTVTVLVPTGIVPSGTLQITENGSHDVTNYETAVVNVASGGGASIPDRSIYLEGDCSYACANAIAAAMLEKFPNAIAEASGLTSMNRMFYNSSVKEIPFDFYGLAGNGGTTLMTNAFEGCSQLEKLPNLIRMQPTQLAQCFKGCINLNDVSSLGTNYMYMTKINSTGTYYDNSEMFMNCYSLRTIPESWLKTCYSNASGYYQSAYRNLFYCCYNLDEIVSLGVNRSAQTENFFRDTFYMCTSLRRFTFETNADGTPITTNWQNQVIDLTNAGFNWITYEYQKDFFYYNSGRTTADVISDEASYEALKNNPNRVVIGSNNPHWYSSYNCESLKETIMSLPDCAQGGITNTIKCRLDAGWKTDGGAVNTIPDSYIQIANNRGWKIQFV